MAGGSMGGSWEKRCDMGIDKRAGGGIAYHQSGIRMPTCVQCMNDQNPINRVAAYGLRAA